MSWNSGDALNCRLPKPPRSSPEDVLLFVSYITKWALYIVAIIIIHQLYFFKLFNALPLTLTSWYRGSNELFNGILKWDLTGCFCTGNMVDGVLFLVLFFLPSNIV